MVVSRVSALVWVVTSVYYWLYFLRGMSIDRELAGNHWLQWLAFFSLAIPMTLMYGAMLPIIMLIDVFIAMEPLFSGDWGAWRNAIAICNSVGGYFNYHKLGQVRSTPWDAINKDDYITRGNVVSHRGLLCTDYVVHTLLVVSALVVLVAQVARRYVQSTVKTGE